MAAKCSGSRSRDHHVDGLPGSGDDLSSLGRRAHGYLVKPVKPDRLLEAIREIIARYRGALDTGSGA
jgi:DNA-binding response OmpR family regulator